MAYRDTIDALAVQMQATLRAAQECPDVSLTEYGELRAIQRRVARLRHQQWQRDTFTHTLPEEMAQ
ncbi:hypothetical protein phiGT1_43 [Sulfitobacter phage phiGT1]|nr:hypothetical protein phiGT1_43 [Sulfitobacter phage phiGT1]